MKVSEIGTLLGSEWKALTESEKKVRDNPRLQSIPANKDLQKYKDAHTADHQRYLVEYKTVYGKDPPSVQKASKKS